MPGILGLVTGDTKWSRLEGRGNALNALRLLLAMTVLASHSMIFSSGQVSLLPRQLGAVAVNGFFAISGFLIAGSRERLPFVPYLILRALRIMPGYWLMLLITAFVFAPLTAGYDIASALGYVWRNALLVQHQAGIGHTIEAGRSAWAAGFWNSSLWTLPYEFGMYLVLGVLFRWRVLRRPAVVGMTFAALTVGAAFAYRLAYAGVGDPNVARFALAFIAGALFRVLRHRIPDKPWLAIASAAVVLLSTGSVTALPVFAPMPLAYLLLWLGEHLPTRIGASNDLSYGVYIYGQPVQQILVSVGFGAVTAGWFALLSFAAVLPLAAASWLLVERPAMRMRRLVRSAQLRDVRSGEATGGAVVVGGDGAAMQPRCLDGDVSSGGGEGPPWPRTRSTPPLPPPNVGSVLKVDPLL